MLVSHVTVWSFERTEWEALPSPGADNKLSLGLEEHVPNVDQKRWCFSPYRHID